MKEKIKLILKHKYFKYLILWLIWLFLINEIYNVYVDMYNFKQLEKVKIILKDLKRENKQFFYLNEFNEIYKSDIMPIKNCYYLRNYKSENRVPYTFWFKLNSYIYIYIYRKDYYIYPKYDLPVSRIAFWWCSYSFFWGFKCSNSSSNDATFNNFYGTISNPCREEKE